MGGRGGSGGRGLSSKLSRQETVLDFLKRAVSDSDRVIIRANDVPSVVGTKSEVINNKRGLDYYFGGFSIEGGDIVITGFTQSESARKQLKLKHKRRR